VAKSELRILVNLERAAQPALSRASGVVMKTSLLASENKLNVMERGDALDIRSESNASIVDRTFSVLATSGFAILAAKLFLEFTLALGLGVLLGALTWLLTSRMRIVTLSVTQAEIRSVGSVGDNFGNTRRVATSAIAWLDYKLGVSGPETSHEPEGLYAETTDGSVCLLPDITREQANLIIDGIERKFPLLAEAWKKNINNSRKLTILGLSE
jgi:hypothetical protein